MRPRVGFREFDDSILEELFVNEVEISNCDEKSECKPYQSKLPRQFVRCVSDEQELQKILQAMDKKNADELWDGGLFST